MNIETLVYNALESLREKDWTVTQLKKDSTWRWKRYRWSVEKKNKRSGKITKVYLVDNRALVRYCVRKKIMDDPSGEDLNLKMFLRHRRKDESKTIYIN